MKTKKANKKQAATGTTAVSKEVAAYEREANKCWVAFENMGKLREIPVVKAHIEAGEAAREAADKKQRAEQLAAIRPEIDRPEIEDLLQTANFKLSFLEAAFAAGGDMFEFGDNVEEGVYTILSEIRENVKKALAEIFPESYGEKKEDEQEEKAA